ncbi:hypothetical protein A5692_18770 [Mycobacterium sp. E342]|nr:hypothetical protein A5692_18770 [Mycobacterium sp. E342]
MSRSSQSEDERMDRAQRMVAAAIEAHPAFDGYRSSIAVYAKGSYANLTNVRADSDVDVVVENRDLYYFCYVPADIAPSPDPRRAPYQGRWNSEDEWRAEVTAALVNKFGATDVDTSGEVAIAVTEVPGSRPSADVVPSFEFRRFDTPDRRIVHVGSRVFKKTNGHIDNYPAQQLANGRAKDAATGGRYKKYVRALKNAENHLAAAGVIDDLPSYFMECLVFNVPDVVMTTGYSLDEGFRATLRYLIVGLYGKSYREGDWVEPNRLKYLFRGNDKWSPEDGMFLAYRAWEYLGYAA